jgi:hypothetical protein
MRSFTESHLMAASFAADLSNAMYNIDNSDKQAVKDRVGLFYVSLICLLRDSPRAVEGEGCTL